MKNQLKIIIKAINKPSSLFIILVVAFAVKLWLSEAIPLRANERAVVDGLLFQKTAQNIILGNWLGEYGRYTFAKGPGYSLWIAIVWFLSIPLRFANEVLYFLSVAVFFRLLSLMKALNFISFIGIVLLLFNPVTLNNWYWGSFMRQNIYFSLCAISIFSLIITYYYACYYQKVQIRWVLLCGITLGYAWITREETIWIIPVFFGTFIFSLFIGNQNLKNIFKKLAIVVIPCLILLSTITTVSYLNHKYYKFYGVSELKSKEFTDAWNAVVGVQHETWRQYRPLRSISLKEINQYSDSMKEIEKFLRKTDKDGNEVPHTWPGATALWSFRHAVDNAGYYGTDFKETTDYYVKLAKEINGACNAGNLKCKPALFGIVHWNESYYKQIIPTFVNVIQSLVRFRGYEIELRHENLMGTRGYNKRIESLAHRGGGYPMKSNESKYYPFYQMDRLAYKTAVLKVIISLYRQYSYWLFLLSLVLLLFYFIKVPDKRSTKQTIALLVLTSLGSMLAIIVVNVLLAITAYNSYVRPLMTATPYYFVLVALLFVVLPNVLGEIKKMLSNWVYKVRTGSIILQLTEQDKQKL